MTSQNLLIDDDNFISALKKNNTKAVPSYRQCAWIKAMKITRDSMHARHAIQLSATYSIYAYSKMLMVVREPERSFDREDSRVAVRDVMG